MVWQSVVSPKFSPNTQCLTLWISKRWHDHTPHPRTPVVPSCHPLGLLMIDGEHLQHTFHIAWGWNCQDSSQCWTCQNILLKLLYFVATTLPTQWHQVGKYPSKKIKQLTNKLNHMTALLLQRILSPQPARCQYPPISFIVGSIDVPLSLSHVLYPLLLIIWL